MPYAQRARARRANRVVCALLLSASACIIVPSIAPAQVLDPLRGYAFDGTPLGGQRPEPRGRDNPVRDAAAAPPSYASIGRIRRLAARQGFNLVSIPHRHGRAYLAVAENGSGHRFELVFNAYTGGIVGQRDIGPIVAATTPSPASAQGPKDQGSQDKAAPAASEVKTAAVAPEPAPVDDGVAAAKAAADKAAEEAADAKRIAEARAEDSRQALLKLKQAQLDARRAAEAKAEEARRQEAVLATQRREEARRQDEQRRSLAAAEAKLAQAKVIAERAAAQVKEAEAEADAARAAAKPAEMTSKAEAPAELAPAAENKAPPAPAATSSSDHAAVSVDAKVVDAKTNVEPTDNAPTGSTVESPPEPYVAPDPDEVTKQDEPDQNRP